LAAQNGEKGCAMAVSERPDIIIMDLEMPILDGWEATRWLKSKPQTRDIPVVALSAHALAGEREKALRRDVTSLTPSRFSLSVCWQRFDVLAGVASDACPLYPRKRTNSRHLSMSALCHKQTNEPQQNGVRGFVRFYSVASSRGRTPAIFA